MKPSQVLQSRVRELTELKSQAQKRKDMWKQNITNEDDVITNLVEQITMLESAIREALKYEAVKKADRGFPTSESI